MSEKTIVSLKNLSGNKIFLEKGRIELENLAPGEIRETSFTFNDKKSESPIEFEIQIVDEVFRDGITSKLSVPNNTKVSRFVEQKENIMVSNENTPIRGGGFAEAPIIALSQEGATFTSTGQNNGWMKINLNEKMAGWINKDKIQALNET